MIQLVRKDRRFEAGKRLGMELFVDVFVFDHHFVRTVHKTNIIQAAETAFPELGQTSARNDDRIDEDPGFVMR